MNEHQSNTSWLAGVLTGWGLKESWAKLIAGALIGALGAVGILTQTGCGHTVTLEADKTLICKDGLCLSISPDGWVFSQSQPVSASDSPPVIVNTQAK